MEPPRCPIRPFRQKNCPICRLARASPTRTVASCGSPETCSKARPGRLSRTGELVLSPASHLARHSRTPEGDPIPEYLAMSNLRFEQWILDTCLAAIRSGLAELPTGNRAPAHQREEKPGGWRPIHSIRAATRHHRLRCRDEPDHPAVSRGEGEPGRGCRGDASRLVQVSATPARALDACVFRPRRMVIHETARFY